METAPGRDVVVVAASAGGVEALVTMVAGLPPGLPAAILAVLHVPATGGRALPRILERAGALPAAAASDGERLEPGRIYVAPPDHHLLVSDDKVRVSQGPRHHGHRPAADPLFRSAAATAGPRVVGVILSGTLDDGAAGCVSVVNEGGVVAVQEPRECAYDGMPNAALTAVPTAVRLPAARLGAFIAMQSREPVRVGPPRPPVDPESFLQPELLLSGAPGRWDGHTCPRCGGRLVLQPGRAPYRYECPLGHGRWTAAALLRDSGDSVERAPRGSPAN
jgi:two-component system chemotaxis response regulator CheB